MVNKNNEKSNKPHRTHAELADRIKTAQATADESRPMEEVFQDIDEEIEVEAEAKPRFTDRSI